jgi:hypothetical protein
VSESETAVRLKALRLNLKEKGREQRLLHRMIPLYYGSTSTERTRCHSEILEFE